MRVLTLLVQFMNISYWALDMKDIWILRIFLSFCVHVYIIYLKNYDTFTRHYVFDYFIFFKFNEKIQDLVWKVFIHSPEYAGPQGKIPLIWPSLLCLSVFSYIWDQRGSCFSCNVQYQHIPPVSSRTLGNWRYHCRLNPVVSIYLL